MDTYNQGIVKDMLIALGEDPNREGLKDTPDRVVRMWDEIFSGYDQRPEDLLKTDFSADTYDEIVLVKDIPFYSHCEHHMVPFFGVAHVAYIPIDRVVGISKLARLVDCYAKRLQIQERLTKQVAEDIMKYVKPLGAAVIIEAEHLCMTMRGVKKPGAKTVTSSMLGAFRDVASARSELLTLIYGNKR